MTGNDETISSSAIAIALIIAAALLGFILSLVAFWEVRTPPMQLPKLSLRVIEIVSISAARGEYPAPVVKGEDGETYLYRQKPDQNSNGWELAGDSLRNDSKPCSWWNEWRLGATAGNIIACLEADASIEWCPGPIVITAINSGGEVWWWEKHEYCWLASMLFYVIPYMVVGGAISIVVVAIREFFFRR